LAKAKKIEQAIIILSSLRSGKIKIERAKIKIFDFYFLPLLYKKNQRFFL
jgi:hypothetical protein